jgi:hypothetical protein
MESLARENPTSLLGKFAVTKKIKFCEYGPWMQIVVKYK